MSAIYLVGDNPLAYYLAAQLQSAGLRTIVLLSRQKAESFLDTDGISIKEDRSLTQKRHRLETSFLMKEPVRAVIITAYGNNINTMLSSISKQKIGDSPVACFTPIKDLSYLYLLLGENLHPAYFNGYLNYNNQSISVFGRSLSITLCPPTDRLVDEDLKTIFQSTDLDIHFSNNPMESFWEYFIPYALCSIFSAAENSKISELLKDKDQKDKFKPLVDEFCSLAAADRVFLNEKIILKNIYSTPASYIYPLHQAIASGEKTEFNLLSSIINSAAQQSKTPIPQTNALLKKIYNHIINDIEETQA